MREDMIASAATFLADPKAAESPLAQRVQFLESKGLTEDEIQEALRRSKTCTSEASGKAASDSSSMNSSQAMPPRPGYSPGTLRLPHSEAPKRDWKDYFVMATASVGISYAIYEVARRYLLPLILPPTPPQLEADKEAVAAEFTKAEQMLQQLQSDSEEMKQAERYRVESVDKAVVDLNNLLEDARKQLDNREREMRQLQTEIESVRTELPKLLDRTVEGHKQDLLEIQNELKSLKQILNNRITASSSANGTSTAIAPANGVSNAESSNSKAELNSPIPFSPGIQTPTSTMRPPTRAGIPAWQLAAANKFKDQQRSGTPTSDAESSVGVESVSSSKSA
ncbi:peroxisomal membrane anchor protein conserved region-domain-containing protein [Dipodascopsis uninucleata]